jgi:cytochrome o ubiquinol oxidase subunit II
MTFDKELGSNSCVKADGLPITGPKPKEPQRLPFSPRSSWLLASGSAALLSGCVDKSQSFLTPGGPASALEYHHLWLITLVTLIVVAPVIVGVPLLAWRYRYGNTRARYAPHWDFSYALEWPMWFVPVAIVVVLSVYLWNYTHTLDPYRSLATDKPAVRVQVVGLDWKWLFIYPDYGIATVGKMAFPQDRPVSMKLTTDTVMQSFMIPALGGQIYAMPGMVTQLNLKADRTGDFEGMNTQYNGNGFHAQHFQAVAMTPQDFDGWVKSVQQNSVALNQSNYRRLAESSTPAEVHNQFGNAAMSKDVTLFNVASTLFAGIVSRYHTGKVLSPTDQPGTAAYNAKLASK